MNKIWKRRYRQVLRCAVLLVGMMVLCGCCKTPPIIALGKMPEKPGPGSVITELREEKPGPESVSEEVNEENPETEAGAYLGGAELRLLACADGGQNLSCVIRTRGGSVIVIDGGRNVDAGHLTEVIESMGGGRVAAWLITHPHSDHIGALTEILNMEPIPLTIDQIYYSFLENSFYESGEHQGRMADLTNLQAAFQRLDAGILHEPVKKGDTFSVDEVTVTVMNDPFACRDNTFNNSSVAYRLELNGKRLLFLGDMGWQAGENLLKVCTPEELKADVVQMAHHGQAGVEKDVYEVIAPEICLWPTPQWLWDNELNGVAGAGPFHTLTVRRWMEELGVKQNLSMKDGDQTLK